jgi:spore maturation protein CgeB
LRILSVVGKYYYGEAGVLEPMYLWFTDPLIDVGHQVDHFDHAEIRTKIGLEGCGERFVAQVKSGHYDVVLYQTAGQDWMVREAIKEAGSYSPVVAWNSDDDWQWETYSRHLAPYLTFMVTTYPHVYDANRGHYPNLLLSQWGCYTRFADFGRRKDFGFTFVGSIYGYRNAECRYLRRKAGLRAFGAGARLANIGLPYFRGASRLKLLYGRAVSFREVHAIWNRSKISYTPMGASTDPALLQIKGRTFEMGLSGTMMLCQHSPNLERYYEPGKEFIAFDNLEDCAGKARYYLAHESERARIARAYRDRTLAEHLWEHRFANLFQSVGLGNGQSHVS